MIKTLILYYSFEGNTEMAAQWMAEAIGADLLKIQPVRELKSKGFSKYIWGGRQVVMKEAPPIQPLDVDLNEYVAHLGRNLHATGLYAASLGVAPGEGDPLFLHP